MKFKWTTGHSLLYQVPLLLSLPFYFIYGPTPSAGLIWTSLALFISTEISITAGYHRLFAHKSYKTHPVIEFIFLLFGGMAYQKSALRWAFEHRCHHAFVDTDRDPYSIKRGFWFAHFAWTFEDEIPIDKKMVADLIKKPMVVFQDKYDHYCMMGPNILSTLIVGWMFQDYLGALILSFGLRLFLTHHCTFFINSLAHTYGSRPFSKTITAVNNFLISFPTFGEGFHNFHHAFPNDYRNGVRWFDFDPTKWLIYILSKLRLAKDLKITTREQIKKVAEEKH